MTKRVITKLPDACSFKTGERIKCNSRIYEKKKSGRWATVITKKLLEEVYKVYCLEGCNLTQTKNKLNLPGLPTVPVQKILEENNWFRSHYKRGKRVIGNICELIKVKYLKQYTNIMYLNN